MLLKDIYDKDIFREINPAVVVSDQKDATIKSEIEEYVFTDELIEKLYIILDTVLNKKDVKTGIWINGYYGSGKSHFLKFVHYLFNPSTSETAFNALEKAIEKYDNMYIGANQDITLSNVRLLRRRLDTTHSDNILFNVEDETDDGSKERLTRIFLNMFNKFRGFNANDIPLAILLEKPLFNKGVFEEFKKLISSELGFDWENDAAQVASFQLESVLEIAKQVYPEMDTVSLHGKLSNPESFKIGIKATLIPELKDFLESKDKDYRLVFLVDEVSQYVGTNKEILLNFQNIIERVSADCNSQVWIACTAQQSLDEVSFGIDGVQNVQNEFGKILGRFDTRISLQSNDASYITQRRVLEKSSEGIKELSSIYHSNKDYIENQFKINHELYKGYQSEDEFFISYPFIPYQFKLIAHVFEAFQQLQFVIKEVKDNERSVLGITHFTAKQHANDKVGGFIPFDGFYNQQFQTNLTNRGSRAIESGLELPFVKQNAFATRVVKVLFMISNLLESQRQTFPSTIENLGVLLMDKLDQNKMQLQKNIKEVLYKLIDESIIREDKGNYFFFNEDEIDVQNVIKNQTVGLDDRYTTFDKLLRPIIGIKSKTTFGKRDFKIAYSIENKEFVRNGDFRVVVLFTDNTPIKEKIMTIQGTDLALCLNEWFSADSSLRRNIDWYCKTNQYLTNNGNGGNGSRSQTNESFRIRNGQLKDKIVESLKMKFNETRFISQDTIIEPNEINGSDPAIRIKNLIDRHLSGIYKYNKLSNHYAHNQSDLKKSASDTQTFMSNELEAAEQHVNDFISQNNHQITVHDLIKRFESAPFGWQFEVVLDILVRLVKKKKREFVYKGQKRFPIVDFINRAVKSSEQTSCEVVTGEDIDQAVLNQVVTAYKTIFNDSLTPSTDGNELFDTLVKALEKNAKNYYSLDKKYYGSYPFGICFQQASEQLNRWKNIRDPKKLFTTLIESQEISKELFDRVEGIKDFALRSLEDYNKMNIFINKNGENIEELEEIDRAKAMSIREFLQLEDPRKEFRHARKAYDEVKQALDVYTQRLRDEVLNVYIGIFEEISREAEISQVNEREYVKKEYKLSRIRDMDSIVHLNNQKLDANNFKTQQLESIINIYTKEQSKEETKEKAALKPIEGKVAFAPKISKKIVKESTTYHLAKGTNIIRNENDLDIYLARIEREMRDLLENDKTIILK